MRLNIDLKDNARTLTPRVTWGGKVGNIQGWKRDFPAGPGPCGIPALFTALLPGLLRLITDFVKLQMERKADRRRRDR